MDHLTQNIICPEFFNHELLPAKKFAESQAAAALSDPAVILMEEAHRVSWCGMMLNPSVYLPIVAISACREISKWLETANFHEIFARKVTSYLIEELVHTEVRKSSRHFLPSRTTYIGIYVLLSLPLYLTSYL